MNEPPRFTDNVLQAVSPETRRAMEAFAQSIVHAEGLLRAYHVDRPSPVISREGHPMDVIRASARLVFTMTWTKAALFSRAVVNSFNDGNLLVAFQAMRGYVELVAAIRYSVFSMQPLLDEAARTGQVTTAGATSLQRSLDLLLHGGRFNWGAYFTEGASSILDRKKMKRTKAEKQSFETAALRIGTCIDRWAKEEPAVEFIYDFLSDLVHPNKGSNLLILMELDGSVVFHTEGKPNMGLFITERIFPYAASMCLGSMGRFQLFFGALGADE